jgi:NAD(P)-dependent dehydrogenase (short-subunit alcohol dehydrogenase family)
MEMPGRLEGKSAVVTGGGGGIGAATALKMGLEGASVAVLDIQPELAEGVASQIRETGGTALGLSCDVTKEAEVAAAFVAAGEAHGTPTVLLNNAGINGPLAPAPETPLDQFDECVAVNLRGMFVVAAEFLRRVRAADLPAAIVNTASIDALYAEPNAVTYNATKGAIVALSRSMALDHARQGVRVNCICPGHVLTPMTARFYEAEPGALEAAGNMHAIGRIGRPEEIANVAVFLACDEASFVTGSTMVVDGGMSIGAQVIPESDVYGSQSVTHETRMEDSPR